MRPSVYNFIIDNGENYILYNSFSDNIILLTTDLYELYSKTLDNIDELKNIYPQFFDYLVSMGIIVDDNEDEAANVLLSWEKIRHSEKRLRLTINPTLNCNMRCWYCYEHKKPSRMTQETIEGIIDLISHKMNESSTYEVLLLSFFGGEPLLAFHGDITTILTRAKEICDRNKKPLYTHFTTNGYLLNHHILDELRPFEPSFQITLDGNSYLHNLTKQTKSDKDTYSKIVENIRESTAYGYHVDVRLNYTSRSLKFFLDVISDFANLDDDRKRLLSFNFQRVWQDSDIVPADRLVEEVHQIEHCFTDAGLPINPSSSNSFGRCYADCDDSIVVNYNGLVYKCTARDFTEENSEGELMTDGNIKWNKKHHLREREQETNEVCRKCKILPLCHGGCTQYKMETKKNGSACLKGFLSEDRQRIIHNRIHDILLVNDYNTKHYIKTGGE